MIETCRSLFADLLGDDYRRLPAAVRAFHDAPLPARFEGRAIVQPAKGLLARLLARVARLPLDGGEVPVVVSVSADGDGQRWSRQSGDQPMVSTLRRDGSRLRERLGWTTLRFELQGDASGLQWHLVSVRVFAIPLPVSWFAGMHARESEGEGGYRFFVGAAMKPVGHLIAYEGWLRHAGP